VITRGWLEFSQLFLDHQFNSLPFFFAIPQHPALSGDLSRYPAASRGIILFILSHNDQQSDRMIRDI